MSEPTPPTCGHPECLDLWEHQNDSDEWGEMLSPDIERALSMLERAVVYDGELHGTVDREDFKPLPQGMEEFEPLIILRRALSKIAVQPAESDG